MRWDLQRLTRTNLAYLPYNFVLLYTYCLLWSQSTKYALLRTGALGPAFLVIAVPDPDFRTDADPGADQVKKLSSFNQ
jgi:hypothetical protein